MLVYRTAMSVGATTLMTDMELQMIVTRGAPGTVIKSVAVFSHLAST
jgi:hypothetical protein